MCVLVGVCTVFSRLPTADVPDLPWIAVSETRATTPWEWFPSEEELPCSKTIKIRRPHSGLMQRCVSIERRTAGRNADDRQPLCFRCGVRI